MRALKNSYFVVQIHQSVFFSRHPSESWDPGFAKVNFYYQFITKKHYFSLIG